MMTPAQAIGQLRREITEHEARWRALVDQYNAPWASVYDMNMKQALRHATIARELRGALSAALGHKWFPRKSWKDE